MKRSMMVLISIGTIFFLSTLAGSAGGFEVGKYNYSEIIKMAYSEKVYLSYENDSPVFYLNKPKEFVLNPGVVKVGDDSIARKVSDLGFKTGNEDYDILISTKDVDTGKKAIIFLSGDSGFRKELIWIEDPLRLSRIEVNSYCNLSIDGKVIAMFDDGSNAIVESGNKIYSCVEPDKAVLANLLTYQITEKNSSLSPVILTALFIPATLGVIWIFYESLARFLGKTLAWISYMVIALGGYINLADKIAVLKNDVRKKIYDYILENPGAHLSDICRHFDISLSTASWHLKLLEKSGLIKSEKIGNKIVYHPVGMVKEDLVLMMTLSDDRIREVIAYLIENYEAHLRKISRDLGLNVETARTILRKMENAGIVKAKEKGNKIVYTLNYSVFETLKHKS